VSVSVWVGNSVYEIGAASFLNSFFSTIYVRLEDKRWGSRFPVTMREFYSGHLSLSSAETATSELRSIREMLARLPPDQLVRDFEDPAALPPGGPLSTEVTSLAEAFVTSDGKDLFDVLLRAFTEVAKKKKNLKIT